jgi:hypothetical protein
MPQRENLPRFGAATTDMSARPKKSIGEFLVVGSKSSSRTMRFARPAYLLIRTPGAATKYSLRPARDTVFAD